MLDKRPEETDERCLKEVIKKQRREKACLQNKSSSDPQLQWPGWGSALLAVGRGCRVFLETKLVSTYRLLPLWTALQ